MEYLISDLDIVILFVAAVTILISPVSVVHGAAGYVQNATVFNLTTGSFYNTAYSVNINYHPIISKYKYAYVLGMASVSSANGVTLGINFQPSISVLSLSGIDAPYGPVLPGYFESQSILGNLSDLSNEPIYLKISIGAGQQDFTDAYLVGVFGSIYPIKLASNQFSYYSDSTMSYGISSGTTIDANLSSEPSNNLTLFVISHNPLTFPSNLLCSVVGKIVSQAGYYSIFLYDCSGKYNHTSIDENFSGTSITAFIANMTNDPKNISVPVYRIEENGLPVGTKWSVSVKNKTITTNTSRILFNRTELPVLVNVSPVISNSSLFYPYPSDILLNDTNYTVDFVAVQNNKTVVNNYNKTINNTYNSTVVNNYNTTITKQYNYTTVNNYNATLIRNNNITKDYNYTIVNNYRMNQTNITSVLNATLSNLSKQMENYTNLLSSNISSIRSRISRNEELLRSLYENVSRQLNETNMTMQALKQMIGNESVSLGNYSDNYDEKMSRLYSVLNNTFSNLSTDYQTLSLAEGEQYNTSQSLQKTLSEMNKSSAQMESKETELSDYLSSILPYYFDHFNSTMENISKSVDSIGVSDASSINGFSQELNTINSNILLLNSLVRGESKGLNESWEINEVLDYVSAQINLSREILNVSLSTERGLSVNNESLSLYSTGNLVNATDNGSLSTYVFSARGNDTENVTLLYGGKKVRIVFLPPSDPVSNPSVGKSSKASSGGLNPQSWFGWLINGAASAFDSILNSI